MSKPKLEPAIIVIFGITGDLSTRYLLPALYHLFKDNLLHEETEIIGVSRRDVSVDDLLNTTELCVLEDDKVCDPAALKRMREALSMFKMDLANGNDYDNLRNHLNALEDKHGVCMNRLYYLSIPPGVYRPIVALLGNHGLNQSCQHGNAATRLLVEKPFGYDLASARELIAETGEHFNEEQIFRIDHYLAKETVQNILTFRFHNPVFEAVWDKDNVERIDIVASEKIGVEGRAAFYEQTGALRDFVQSHLLQLLAATTMEKPENMGSSAIHKVRLKLLESVEPVPADKVAERTIRGQYDGYREEVGIPHSTVETYATLQLFIDNERWRGVPMRISTGKALNERNTEINVIFRQPDDGKHTNMLTFSIQPSEGIGINLCVKRPGFDDQIETAGMDFSYERSFMDKQGHPSAYERVLVDAVRGDHTLFATSDEVLASWRILECVVEAWSMSAEGLRAYQKGSTGPEGDI
jgi:glucose-6-phosphate 1-dehydrogenase